ncbi:MAG: TIM barrel protein [Verrucomicrobiales bacterium]|nr:TIM barrel protein [Verrucomicrobiales bacterium]
MNESRANLSEFSGSRRSLLKKSALAALGTAVPGGFAARAQLPRAKMDPDFVVKNGRIRQSIMGWCFNNQFDKKDSKKNVLTLAKHCKDIGLVAMEGIPRDLYPEVKKMGLEISLVSGGHGFKNGPCNPKFHDEVVEGLKGAIDAAVEIGCPSVITFTGMRFDGMDDEKAAKDCVDTWKKVVPYAEKNKVTLCLEHLNSRDDSHPMKGHPGYFGDDVDFCVDLINRVGSENFKLLFDIYHVSVMNGDVIRRIRQYKDLIGHYHTAGNPGRGELDNTQEINYPPIMEAIVETGYKGFVAQEFIPNWDDPVAALRHAAQVCDV